MNNTSYGQGSGVPYPAELDNPNVAPELRAQVLELFTARLMEIPQSSWNAKERAAVLAQSNSVLRSLGHNV